MGQAQVWVRWALAALLLVGLGERGFAGSFGPSPAKGLEEVRIEAHVVDEKGAPLEGARLTAAGVQGAPSAESDADGRVTLVLPFDSVRGVELLDARYSIELRGFQTAGRRLAPPAPGDYFLGRFQLTEAGSVVGQVLDGEGVPVSGASVFIGAAPEVEEGERKGQPELLDRPRERSEVTLTDGSGGFRIEGVSPSTCVVVAHAPGTFYAMSAPISVLAGTVVQGVSVRLREAPREQMIRGVFLGLDGEPRGGEPVRLRSTFPARRERHTVDTGPDGSFEILCTEGLIGDLEAGRTGSRRAFMEAAHAGTEALVLSPEPGPWMTVKATGTNGPLDHGFVVTVSVSGTLSPQRVYSSKGEDSVQLLAPREPFELSVRSNGARTRSSGPHRPDDLLLGAVPTTFRFVLPPALMPGSTEGIVGRVDTRGFPAHEWSVSATLVRDPGLATLMASGLHDRFHGATPFRTRVAPSGRFQLKRETRYAIQSGVTGVSLRAESGRGGSGFGPRVFVPYALDEPFPEVTLTTADPGGIIGRVSAAPGVLLEDYVVVASQGDREVVSAEIKADGSYRLDSLAPGRWQVLVGPEEWILDGRGMRPVKRVPVESIPWNAEVSSRQDSTLHLEIAPEPADVARVRGRLRFNGAAPERYSVRAVGPDMTRSDELDSEGRFSVEGRVGPLELYFQPGGTRTVPLTVLKARLDLVAGDNPFELDLPVGSLRAQDPRPRDARDKGGRQLVLGWKDESRGLEWFGTVRLRGTEESIVSVVPAATISVEAKGPVDLPTGGTLPDGFPKSIAVTANEETFLGRREELPRALEILYTEPMQSFGLTREVFEALWTTWPASGPEAHWRARAEAATPEERYGLTLEYYGLYTDPLRGNDVPTAFSVPPGEPEGRWTLSCLSCHGATVGGTDGGLFMAGRPNHTLMFEALVADIVAVKGEDRSGLEDGMVAAQLGRTVGTTEATLFGELLLRFREPNMDLKDLPGMLEAGTKNMARMAAHPMGLLPLDAPPWWQLRHKTHLYLDHSVEKNHRTVMQFTLGLGDLGFPEPLRTAVVEGSLADLEAAVGRSAAAFLVDLRTALTPLGGVLDEEVFLRRVARALPTMPFLAQLSLAPKLVPGGMSGEEIRALDDEFQEIFSYIEAMEPPKYPGSVDRREARKGRELFNRSCARCHGHYDGSGPGYAPKRIELDVIGTDPLYPTALDQEFRDRLRGFLTERPDGTPVEVLTDEEADRGYVAPPLYGVWASAPYLHNGSVPTLEDLLDYSTRARRVDSGTHVWSFDPRGYDPVKVGLQATFLEGADLRSRRSLPRVHDGRRRGMGADGHDFGEFLEPGERRALIEYLKTL